MKELNKNQKIAQIIETGVVIASAIAITLGILLSAKHTGKFAFVYLVTQKGQINLLGSLAGYLFAFGIAGVMFSAMLCVFAEIVAFILSFTLLKTTAVDEIEKPFKISFLIGFISTFIIEFLCVFGVVELTFFS